MNRALWSYLADLVRAHARRVALALVLMVVLGLIEGVGVLMLVPLLQLVGLDMGQGSLENVASALSRLFAAVGLPKTLITVLCAYVAIIGGQGLLYQWETRTNLGLQYDFVVHLRRKLYRAILGCNWLFFTRSRLSDFTQVLTMETDRVGAATYYLMHLLATALVTLVYVLLAVRLSPAMTGLVFVCGGAMLGLLWRKMRVAHRVGEELTAAAKELYHAIAEHLGGMKTAKSFGAEDRHIEMFGQLTAEVSRSFVHAVRNQAETKYWFDVGSVLVLSAVVYVAVEVFKTPTAELLLLLFLFARIIPRFSQLQENYQGFVNQLPAFAAIVQLEQRCRESAEAAPAQQAPVRFRSAIQLDKVSFAYEQSPVVSNLDLTIRAGETTAFVGPSGGGKSTIADLVMGLVLPDAGQVRVDGVPLAPENLRAWRNQIGYVPQETFLFHDTVRANLVWARPEATEEELRFALQLAAAEEFVARLPEGLDTVVGDRGVRLSGGERQRLALARAVLRRPALLILDEATSNLDPENENRILRAIEGLHGRLTILLITHRLATVRRADLIHVVEGGRLVESGTWEALLANETGRLRLLCNAPEQE